MKLLQRNKIKEVKECVFAKPRSEKQTIDCQEPFWDLTVLYRPMLSSDYPKKKYVLFNLWQL